MRYQSRKFIIAEQLIVIATLLCAYNKIPAWVWLAAVSAAGAGYGLQQIADDKLNGRHDTPTLHEPDHE